MSRKSPYSKVMDCRRMELMTEDVPEYTITIYEEYRAPRVPFKKIRYGKHVREAMDRYSMAVSQNPDKISISIRRRNRHEKWARNRTIRRYSKS